MKIIASIFGIGYIGKGGGTVAAVAAALLWYFLQPNIGQQLILVIITLVLGVWSGNKVEADWGKDSSKVVIDEVAGMFIAALFIPVSISYLVAALVLFRFFDIAKPLGVRRMERFKGGWGVMLDDILAGVYANVILQFVVYTKLLE
ncbi:MAG TPA: phosphatidylglycerophosphatase A [Chitinophagaceae bacterium]|nr:phosphatidylglycerophosphatase A [Chitinophagaceae bacterium]